MRNIADRIENLAYKISTAKTEPERQKLIRERDRLYIKLGRQEAMEGAAEILSRPDCGLSWIKVLQPIAEGQFTNDQIEQMQATVEYYKDRRIEPDVLPPV